MASDDFVSFLWRINRELFRIIGLFILLIIKLFQDIDDDLYFILQNHLDTCQNTLRDEKRARLIHNNMSHIYVGFVGYSIMDNRICIIRSPVVSS